jgi:methylated-DNA-protein-cysteine methyltransferase-like protein
MGVRKKTKNQNPIDGGRKSVFSQSGDDTGLSQPSLGPCQPSTKERIWQVVAMIPQGFVATYGQVAGLAGMPTHARYVGRTLRELPNNTRLPWHRVVNASLRISTRIAAGAGQNLQRQRLEAEEVEFIGERIAPAHRWEP